MKVRCRKTPSICEMFLPENKQTFIVYIVTRKSLYPQLEETFLYMSVFQYFAGKQII